MIMYGKNNQIREQQLLDLNKMIDQKLLKCPHTTLIKLIQLKMIWNFTEYTLAVDLCLMLWWWW